MAYGQVIGGEPKHFPTAKTVAEVKAKLGLSGNYTAMVNGEPASLDDEVDEFDIVVFSQPVKGGRA